SDPWDNNGLPFSPAASTNQVVHPIQKDLATCLALLGLVLGFGESDLIHKSTESYAVDDGRIIADFGDLFRVSLDIDVELLKPFDDLLELDGFMDFELGTSNSIATGLGFGAVAHHPI